MIDEAFGVKSIDGSIDAYGPADDRWCGKFSYPTVSDVAMKKVTDAMEGRAPVQAQVGVKFDHDKPKWSLMPKGVLSQVVEVLTYGAQKYSPDNWKKVDSERYYDALHRHVDAFRNGQKHDDETGKHHLAHAVCCLLFMLWIDQNTPQS